MRQLYTFPTAVLRALRRSARRHTADGHRGRGENYRFEESPRSPLQQSARSCGPIAAAGAGQLEHCSTRPLVSELLAAAPGVSAWSRRRERLNLRGEAVYTLDGWTIPPKMRRT